MTYEVPLDDFPCINTENSTTRLLFAIAERLERLVEVMEERGKQHNDPQESDNDMYETHQRLKQRM